MMEEKSEPCLRGLESFSVQGHPSLHPEKARQFVIPQITCTVPLFSLWVQFLGYLELRNIPAFSTYWFPPSRTLEVGIVNCYQTGLLWRKIKSEPNTVKGIESEYKTYSFIKRYPAFDFILTLSCFFVSQEAPICFSFFLNGLLPICP